MSGTSSRVLAFLQRAQELTAHPSKSPSRTPPRSITPQKVQIAKPPIGPSISPLKSARDSTPPSMSEPVQKIPVKLTKTIGPKRISPQKSITPKNKTNPAQAKPRNFTPKNNEPKPKTIGIESLNEIESLVDNLMKTRQNIDEKIKEQQDKEFEVINMIKDSLNKNKGKDEEFDSVQQAELYYLCRAYKKKTEKLLEVVKEEAQVMDKKLSELQRENERLKALIASKGETTSYNSRNDSRNSSTSDNHLSTEELKTRDIEPPKNEEEYGEYIDNQIVYLFQEVETKNTPELQKQLCIALAKKLVHEQQQRLKTEEQATKMISEEEKLIASLEERLKALEGRDSSDSIELSY